ncbi:YdcF family protein [Amaricoccus sp.]|uniref:YdcF family protein n=1 Tax=Amaricoccus sp. TaxID=1872485 RepID=UPI001B5983AD|nr:YdcF family protein [Amaricoccus sp.]MBP7002209.1 YdcF family protein [Amaricoccus sp.]
MTEPEALVVLGARVLANGAPGPALRRRIRHARRVWAAAPAAIVVASGGPAGARVSEAAVIARALRAGGVPEAAILVEDRSRDTFENVRFAVALLRERGVRRALVVSDRHHLPRALLTFRLLGMPVTGSGPPWGSGGRPLRRARALLREAAALPWCAARAIAWRLSRG